MKPITPKLAEAKAKAGDHIPPGVIQAFNELISENFRDGNAHFTLSAVADRAVRHSGMTRNELFNKRYFDVEDTFQGAGWTVVFDKADLGEGESWWTFEKTQ